MCVCVLIGAKYSVKPYGTSRNSVQQMHLLKLSFSLSGNPNSMYRPQNDLWMTAKI